MAIKKVQSSMVWAVDYDPKTQVLEVAFKRTGVFQYSEVPVAVYKAMMQSNSIGSYLRSFIIGMYPEDHMG
ncbi:MAG: KTSC domain-containing protein [Rhodocyclales bacterium]|nr:KTSC domain-containing protein [Rhodocyclales bacterium]